jgi:hypothetical protein
MTFQTGGLLMQKGEAVFHSIAKFRAQIHKAVIADRSVFQADGHKENCRTVDCYSQWSEFESGKPQA